MKKTLLGFYDYTVILTYCGMLSAMAGIFQILENNYLNAMMLLMIAGVCDMFDGLMASTKNRTIQEKSFGIQIDSLSDLISFGILPAVFLYSFFDHNVIAAIISAGFALCALIRLAYFNVMEGERQKNTDEKRKTYLGLPVTSIAVLLPATYLIYNSGIVKTKNIFPSVMIIVAVCFLLPFEIKKPAARAKAGIVLIGLLEMLSLLVLMRVRPL